MEKKNSNNYIKFIEELKKVIDNPIVGDAKVTITIKLKKSK